MPKEPGGAYGYDFAGDPEFTGATWIPLDPKYVQIYGNRWLLDNDQWHVVAHIILKWMIFGAGQNSPDNQVTTPSRYIAYAPIDNWATKLLLSLHNDPKKIYALVPYASKINWRNYACLAAWFGWLKPEYREEFLRDVDKGATERWLPVVRDVAMKFCPQAILQDKSLDNAWSAMGIDPDPFREHGSWPKPGSVEDADWDRINSVYWNARNAWTPGGGDTESFVPPTLSSLPQSLLCSPFPACVFGPAGGQSSLPTPAEGQSLGYPAAGEYVPTSGSGEPPGTTPAEQKTNWTPIIVGGLVIGILSVVSYKAAAS